MAVKVVHVSDISGKEADEQSLGRLVVHEHPEYADLPVTLEVLPVLYTIWRYRQLRRSQRTGIPLETIVGAVPAWARR